MKSHRRLALSAALLAASATAIGTGTADAASSGAGDVLGDGSTAQIAVVDDTLRVTLGDGSIQQRDLPPISTVSSHPNDIHLYDLDPVPGKEIVIDRGGNGSYHWYAVYTIRDGQLTWVNGPGDAFDLAGGGWRLLAEHGSAVVVCRDGGQIALATVTGGESNAMQKDFVYSPSEQPVGDQSDYRPESDWRPVPADSIQRALSSSGAFACADGLQGDDDDDPIFPD